MKHFGIIGKPVAQSFSARYFGEKFIREKIDAEYRLYELDRIEHIEPLLEHLDGFNVTIPYKQAIMPYLTETDVTAQAVGAVNVVLKRQKGDKANRQEGEELIGYNTDWIGFMESIKPMLLPHDQHALIFGTGGAAKAVAYGLKRLGISYDFVSRNAQCTMQNAQCLNYETLTKEIIERHTILVNCTPLGMWPKTEECVHIPYQGITQAHILYDCVYNPEETLFLRRGREQGARTLNGLGMLYGQAEAAWKIWGGEFRV